MRTTVTLDPDAEHLIRERMRAKGVSFKQALNDAIRDSRPGGPEPFSTPVFDMGIPRLNLDKALQLAGELEDEELTGGLRRGG